MKSYKIAYVNSKGGVGKSTLCMLSSLCLAQSRFKGKVKLLDTDIQKSSISILADLKTKIDLEYVPFNHSSPALGASLLDQKLKAYPREDEILLIDTMAQPPRQLINCLMQCNAIITPCNLSEVEVMATVEFVRLLDSLKKIQATDHPHLVIVPNRVPPNQIHLEGLTGQLKDIDVIIGPTISDLAILRNDLKNLPLKGYKNNKKLKEQFAGFQNFLYKALFSGEIDRLLRKDEHIVDENINNENNVVQLSV